MTKTESDLKHLLEQCCASDDVVTANHIMPNFDALAYEWLNQELVPNSHIMDEFNIWCDLDTRKTYAVIRTIGGFFRSGAVFAGGLQLDSPAEAKTEKVSIAGYCWETDGKTWMLSNTDDIDDGLNEAWCDCDDWLFGPCFFMGLNPDGTIIERKSFPSTVSRESIEQSLFDLGFRRPDHETEMLERLIERSNE